MSSIQNGNTSGRMRITMIFTSTRSGRFIPMQLTKSHRLVDTIRVPGGAENGEVKYTSVVMAIVNTNGMGPILSRVVYRSVTGVTRIVAMAPSTKTATMDAVVQTLVSTRTGLSLLRMSMRFFETTLEMLAPLRVADTGSTVVNSITAR